MLISELQHFKILKLHLLTNSALKTRPKIIRSVLRSKKHFFDSR
jgi:hypothetical protein